MREMTRRNSLRPLGLVLPLCSSGCSLDDATGCAPHEEQAIFAPDNRHVAQRWVSICGFPGETVTDIISVTDGPVAQPDWDHVVAFNEQQGDGVGQLSAFWVNDRHLCVRIDAFGDMRESPADIDAVSILYALGPAVDLGAIAAEREAKIDERRQWERLKTSAAWNYVAVDYD